MKLNVSHNRAGAFDLPSVSGMPPAPIHGVVMRRLEFDMVVQLNAERLKENSAYVYLVFDGVDCLHILAGEDADILNGDSPFVTEWGRLLYDRYWTDHPLGYIYRFDDGRTFLATESGWVEWYTTLPGSPLSAKMAMTLCTSA